VVEGVKRRGVKGVKGSRKKIRRAEIKINEVRR
jgi:hypothetical protein